MNGRSASQAARERHPEGCGRTGELHLRVRQDPFREPSGNALSDLLRFPVQLSREVRTGTVYFHGHYDVVPASESSQFDPVVKNGNMFGRGTADMKAGLGLMLFAVKALKECGARLQGRIGLTFVPDEETGGARGSNLLSQQGILGKHGIAMFTAEPTGGVVWNGSRGA